MRVKLLIPWGAYHAGDMVDVTYTVGANLVYAQRAEEVKQEDVTKKKALETPPKDKMVRKYKSRRKRKEAQ